MATVFTSVIPFLGAAAVWEGGVLYLLLIGQWPKAIVLAIWGAGVVSTVDNFLRPRLVAGRVGLGELPMFFAMLGGLQVFGALGIVLGPVLLATAASVIDVLLQPGPSSAELPNGTSPAPAPMQKEGIQEAVRRTRAAP
jgi:predicted PurR-regulated permease PerM